MKKKNEDQEPKSMLGRWRRRRATIAPPGSNLPGVAVPMPSTQPTPGVPDPGSSAGRKDDLGRPTPKVHRKAPAGGPVRGGG